MARDKLDEVIQAVASRHGVALGRDDPILILQTMNERLMEEGRQAQEQLLERFRSELEAASLRWGDESRQLAEKSLSAALAASRATIEDVLKQSANQTGQSLRRHVEEMTRTLNASVRVSRQIALINLLASGFTALATGLLLWGVIRSS